MDSTEKEAMLHDIILQIAIFLLLILTFLFLFGVPQKLVNKFRYRLKPTTKAKRHFVKGAQLLSQARSSKNLPASNSGSDSGSFSGLVQEALEEADKSIALNPKDAAPYLLKSLALELQGFRTSALETIDMALSPLAVKSLEDDERGDALLKRAELKNALKVDSVVEDLTQVVKLSPKNLKGWVLLGEWYEGKKMEDEAKNAYNKALQIEPRLSIAQQALNRLASS
ncbi:hypothetical protein Lal_00020689 [Lupinus albus]|uniref:Putative acetyltransferase A, auxiliary subunit n=1 Tax=Lupinus albus TaxID=3870 RepID=A0A6A4Q660_LUPAL|nr:putative acetyltransferase A, auxiliary subunit [Lupinus albus]KAF1871894.1 hypothetical protein Lal_00020689 [Lupinus albus]